MSLKADTYLARTELFGSLDATCLGELGAQSRMSRYRKGQLIYGEGDPATGLLVVGEGLVKVTKVSPDGSLLILALRRPPDILGEAGIMDGSPRVAAVEVATSSLVVLVPRDVLLDVLATHPAVMERLLVRLDRLLRQAIEGGSDLVFRPLEARVAKLLLDLSSNEARCEASPVIDLDLTQGDLAAMVGGSRPAVNRILRNFERRHYLMQRGHTIVLNKPGRIWERAQG